MFAIYFFHFCHSWAVKPRPWGVWTCSDQLKEIKAVYTLSIGLFLHSVGVTLIQLINFLTNINSLIIWKTVVSKFMLMKRTLRCMVNYANDIWFVFNLQLFFISKPIFFNILFWRMAYQRQQILFSDIGFNLMWHFHLLDKLHNPLFPGIKIMIIICKC